MFQFAEKKNMDKDTVEAQEMMGEASPSGVSEEIHVEMQSEPVEINNEFMQSNAEANKSADELESEKETALEIDWKDQCLRALAEVDTARRTIPKRIEEGICQFKSRHFLELLDLADGFDRALKKGGEDKENWKEGVESLQRILENILQKSGVSRVEAKDRRFDPTEHEAVTAIAVPGREDGEILEVIRSGWKLDGRLLRPASVVTVRNES